MGSQCHMSVVSEHQVNFSTAAAAQERLMRVRYAEAIGGGLIADWSLSSLQSPGLSSLARLTSPTGNRCFIAGLGFNYFSNSHPLCILVNSGKVTYFICCRWTSDEKENMWKKSIGHQWKYFIFYCISHLFLHTQITPNVNSWCLHLTFKTSTSFSNLKVKLYS